MLLVTVTGACRTDLKLIRVEHRNLVLPRIPGEEAVGTISELGVDVKKCFLNQRVYVYPGTSCGYCKQYLASASNLCREMQILGFHRDGGFAEYVLTPNKSLIALLDNITDAEAVFAEPLSCCLNGIEQVKLKKMNQLQAKYCRFHGCFYRHGTLALEYIGSGKVKVNDLVSHKMPRTELEFAIDLVGNSQCIKMHVIP